MVADEKVESAETEEPTVVEPNGDSNGVKEAQESEVKEPQELVEESQPVEGENAKRKSVTTDEVSPKKLKTDEEVPEVPEDVTTTA